MPSHHEITDILTTALGGSVRELPSDDRSGRILRLVVLADQRMPLLVRDWGHTVGVCLVGVRGWQGRPAIFDAVLVREIVGATQAWASGQSLESATMFECAAVVVDRLAAHTGGPWTVSIPGVVVPRELWLNACAGSASVGVFSDAVRVWSGSHALETVLATRADLVATSSGLQAIAAAVDGQLAEHSRNVDLSRRVEAVAERLVDMLEPRLGAGVSSRMGSASHSSSIRTHVEFAGFGTVRVLASGGRVVVEAGLVGEQGWSGSGETFDAIGSMVDPIVEALERARVTLTIEKLSVGCQYEVLEDLQALRAGMVVRFDGFDDIDNHYGRYEFTSRDGVRVAVAGDFSTPRHSPLCEAHRYLKVLDPRVD